MYVITNQDRTKFISANFDTSTGVNTPLWTTNPDKAYVYDSEIEALVAEEQLEESGFIVDTFTYVVPFEEIKSAGINETTQPEMLDINEIISQGTAKIDQAKFITRPNVTERMNIINNIGRNMGIEQMSTDCPDAFAFLKNYLEKKLGLITESEMNEDIKLIEEALQFALNEAPSESIPTSKYINRYQDEDVVKIIKQLCKKDFKDFKLTKIVGDEGGGFYSIDVVAHVDDMQDSIEQKRFVLAKMMADFRSKFFGSISKVLPIVNIKTTPYQFTKNSDKVKFGLVMVLSNTDDRDWVNGHYKRPDTKAADKLVDTQTKEDIKEAVQLEEAIELDEAGMARFQRMEFTVPDGVEVFDVVERLEHMGVKASVVNNNTLVAKWNVKEFTPEEIKVITHGQ